MANEMIMVIEESQSEEYTWTDETGDYDREYSGMRRTSHRIFNMITTPDRLRKDLERYNDGDYDHSVRVLFVTKINGEILLDFVNYKYIHAHDYITDKDKERAYSERMKAEGEHHNRKQDEMLERIEKYPELIWNNGGK